MMGRVPSHLSSTNLRCVFLGHFDCIWHAVGLQVLQRADRPPSLSYLLSFVYWPAFNGGEVRLLVNAARKQLMQLGNRRLNSCGYHYSTCSVGAGRKCDTSRDGSVRVSRMESQTAPNGVR